MTTLFRTGALTGFAVIAFFSVYATTQAQVRIQPPVEARPQSSADLTPAQATECRAVAEVLRERQYAAMDDLLLRAERTPNLSPEALTETQKTVAETQMALKAAEGYVERFIFAAVPGQAQKKRLAKEDAAALNKRLELCLSQAPDLRPGLR